MIMGTTRIREEPDERLVAGSLEGNEKAFRQLVERYHAMAYSVVRGLLGDSDDVEDVLQNVFIKVYKGLKGYRGDAKLSTWIYRIARNEAVNAVRKVVPPGTPVDDVVVESPARSQPDEQYGEKARREDLEHALARLDENYRVVLELRYMGEMSYTEIGETMGIPVGTVKTYIHRAKVALKQVMTRNRFTEEHKGLERR
jgi:RNA polymerase sigma-70 factor (ECF subfamily)